MAAAFDKLLVALRAAAAGRQDIDEATWNRRYILHKPQVAAISMHTPSASSDTSNFTLFPPLVDLVEAKRNAERQQAEEEERARRSAEEKRRRKEDEQKMKKQAKAQEAA